MKAKLSFVPALLVLLVIAGCAPAPTASTSASVASAPATLATSAKVTSTATPAGIPPVAVAPGLAVAPAIVPPAPRIAKFNILVVGCPDGRCLEEVAGTRTNVRYFHSIAGVPPQNFSEILSVEEAKLGAKFDLIVVGTHDGFCGTGRCGGQELLDRLLLDPDLKVSPELVQTKAWVRSNIVSPKVLSQALLNGVEVVRLTGGQRNVLITVFDTSSQRYNPVRVYTSGRSWSPAVTEIEWAAAETAGWKQIPSILTKGVSMPESATAFIADNQVQAPALAEIAKVRNFRAGQTFPEVIVTNSTRPLVERLGIGPNQGERFVVTLGKGMNPVEVNAQIAYALAHAKTGAEGLPATNLRFVFETGGLEPASYLASAETNAAFRAWFTNPAMKGEATLELWQDLQRVSKVTLKPAGVPVQSFLMRGGGGGAMMLIPGVFFEAYKLAAREDVVGAQNTFSPNAAANALPKEYGLELSPVYRVHVGPDPMTMWSMLINRVPAGEGKACVKRALTDVAGSLLLIQTDIPTMLSVCPNIWPPKSELVGAAIVYTVPGSSQEPIVVAYNNGAWAQVSGSKLEYQLRVMNKAGIPFQAVFQMAIENGKEVHRFVRLVCGPPGFGDKLQICK